MTPDKFKEATADIPVDVIEKLRAEYRRVYFVTDQPDIAFKPATKAQWRRFEDLVAEKRAVDAIHTLVLDCVVHPSPADFKALVEDYPGIPSQVAVAITEVANRERGTAAKKLEMPTSEPSIT